MMTRMSSTMASSILRKLSAWRSSAEKKSSLLSLVTPSTQRATSSPNSLRTCSTVTLVSSTTSCSRPVSMATSPCACRPGCGRPSAVHHVRLAGIARLALVIFAGEAEGLFECGEIVFGAVFADLGFQFAVQLLDRVDGRSGTGVVRRDWQTRRARYFDCSSGTGTIGEPAFRRGSLNRPDTYLTV